MSHPFDPFVGRSILIFIHRWRYFLGCIFLILDRTTAGRRARLRPAPPNHLREGCVATGARVKRGGRVTNALKRGGNCRRGVLYLIKYSEYKQVSAFMMVQMDHTCTKE